MSQSGGCSCDEDAAGVGGIGVEQDDTGIGNGTDDDDTGGIGDGDDTGVDSADSGDVDEGDVPSDPCGENPCTEPDRGVCEVDGEDFVCLCDPGFFLRGEVCVPNEVCLAETCGEHGTCEEIDGRVDCECEEGWTGLACERCADGWLADDNGLCVFDLCTPDFCAEEGQVCRTVDGAPVCFSPECDEPSDGIACTLDVCDEEGNAAHFPSDAFCNDALFCTGVERCMPESPDADSDGCVHISQPEPPEAEHPCVSYGVCSEELQGFERIETNCPTIHCGNISEDETWAAGENHLIACDTYVGGESNPTLTIADGATVRFAPGTSLFIGSIDPGRLDVQGELEGALFTSDAEDPAPGDWGRLEFGFQDSGSTLLGLTLEYAGFDESSGVVIDQANPTIRGALIQMNLVHGILIGTAGAATITETTIRDNFGDGLHIEDEGGLSASFDNNTITGNGRYAVLLPASQAHRLDASSTYVDNDDSRIWLEQDIIAEDATWQALDVDYYIHENVQVGSPEAPVLTLEDGVTLRFGQGATFGVGDTAEGRLVVEGAQARVHMRALGDTPSPGVWVGLSIGEFDQGSELFGLNIFDAGDGPFGALTLYFASPTLTEVRIEHSSKDGLRVGTGAFPHIVQSHFSNNALNGVHISSGGGLSRTVEERFSDNTMENNGSHPITLPANSVGQLDTSSRFAGNTIDRIHVTNDEVEDNAVWEVHDVEYTLSQTISFNKPNGRCDVLIKNGTRFWVEAGVQINVFSCDFQTEAGPDTVNFVADLSEPAAGHWHGLHFGAGSTGATLADAVIRHAGFENEGDGTGQFGSVYVIQANINIRNSIIAEGDSHGVYLRTSAGATIEDTLIEGHANGGLFLVNTARLGEDGDQAPTFVRNTVTGNGGPPVEIPAPQVTFLGTDSTYTGNVGERATIRAKNLNFSGTWRALDVDYLVTGGIYVLSNGESLPILTIDSGVNLFIEPGAGPPHSANGFFIADGADAGIRINGTAESPVRFTSSLAEPIQGNWAGVKIGSNCEAGGAEINHAIVEYGGGNRFGAIWWIDCEGGIIRNSHVAHSSTYGMRLIRSSITREGMSYDNNADNNEQPP